MTAIARDAGADNYQHSFGLTAQTMTLTNDGSALRGEFGVGCRIGAENSEKKGRCGALFRGGRLQFVIQGLLAMHGAV